jgi:hypothetical protein
MTVFKVEFTRKKKGMWMKIEYFFPEFEGSATRTFSVPHRDYKKAIDKYLNEDALRRNVV